MPRQHAKPKGLWFPKVSRCPALSTMKLIWSWTAYNFLHYLFFYSFLYEINAHFHHISENIKKNTVNRYPRLIGTIFSGPKGFRLTRTYCRDTWSSTAEQIPFEPHFVFVLQNYLHSCLCSHNLPVSCSVPTIAVTWSWTSSALLRFGSSLTICRSGTPPGWPWTTMSGSVVRDHTHKMSQQ